MKTDSVYSRSVAVLSCETLSYVCVCLFDMLLKNFVDNQGHLSLIARGEASILRFGGLEPRSWRARERQPISWMWGLSPQRGSRGQSPGWGSGRGRIPLKLKAFQCPIKAGKFTSFTETTWIIRRGIRDQIRIVFFI